MNRISPRTLTMMLAAAVVTALGAPAEAGTRGRSRSSVNRGGSHNVNRNTNINSNRNVNVNVNRDVHVHGGYYGGGCCYGGYHPVATAAAVTATAMVTSAVIGSIVHSVPSGCSTVMVNGFAYQQCGGTWYQPQMSGSSTTYIVVNAPR